MKMYINRHSPRKIPVGYSAADDLRYRKSLAHFLECGDELTSVDFYGVNSYQWCGHQTFDSSGYDTLVDDYKDYSLPLFMSEYGCNAVYPRLFQEVIPLYTPMMTSVFSGGLVYEFTQEPNNYGLVELDQSGNAYIIPDFDTLKEKFSQVGEVEPVTPKELSRPLVCKETYEHLNTDIAIPNSFGTDMITNGLPVRRGTYVQVSLNATMHRIYDTNGIETADKTIQLIKSLPKRADIGGSSLLLPNASKSGTKKIIETDPATTSDINLPLSISRKNREEQFKHLGPHKRLDGVPLESSSAHPSTPQRLMNERKSSNSGARLSIWLVIQTVLTIGVGWSLWIGLN